MRRGDDDASAILRTVPSGGQQPQDGPLAAASAYTAGGQRWDEDQEDETRSEIGNENFKARAQSTSRVAAIGGMGIPFGHMIAIICLMQLVSAA
jgi:hypothetical protein